MKEPDKQMKTGIELIAEERKEQIEKHGYTNLQDQACKDEQLLDGAYAYLVYDKVPTVAKDYWPWDLETFKPSDHISNLKKSAAMIAAEIDRLQAITKNI